MNLIAQSVVSKLDRAAMLEILSEAPETVLRGAVAGLLNGTPVEAQPQAVTASPKAKPDVAKAKPVATPKAPANGGVTPAEAINALAPDGFAVSDLAALTGLDPKSSALKTAIKNAIAGKKLHTFGERRFLRYGATTAIAKKRSEEDRKGSA